MDREELIAHVGERFSTEPEYLWADLPDTFIFRHRENRKWFAVVMEAERAKLGLPGDGKATLLDVKCGPILSGSYLGQPGVIPAYHMNKTHWIGVLPGVAPAETVKELLEISYELTGPKRGKKRE